MPGIDIHRHSNYETALFWNKQRNTGYTSCIAMYSVDCLVDSQLWYLLECGGLVGQCKCCYMLLGSLDDLLGDGIFKTSPESERHSSSPMSVREWNLRRFTCLCPELSPLDITNGVFMTVFCLKHSTLQVVPPTFHKLSGYWKERVL